MAEEEKEIVNNITNCVQDCSKCTAACDTNMNSDGPSFFERLESISEYFDDVSEESIIGMLNDAVAELEAADTDEAADNEGHNETGNK